jgi:hypothetical protein
MIGRGSFRLPRPHPLPRKRSPSPGRECVTENYHDRVSFPGGAPALNPLRRDRAVALRIRAVREGIPRGIRY